jgi:uncharacterized protein (DUF1800 family)
MAVGLGIVMLTPYWAGAQIITSFTVINADSGAVIGTYTGQATVSRSTFPNINIRANTSGASSVVFTDSAGATRIEAQAPFAYKGNNGGTYNKWAPGTGSHVINAKPLSGSNGTGAAGPVATLALTIVNTASPTTPSTPTTPTPPGTQGSGPTNPSNPPGSLMTRNEASRFLAQATFGPTDTDIDRLMTIGYSAWIDEQFAMPRSGTHQAYLEAAAAAGSADDREVVHSFWKQALSGRDQLRQRMAYALSQIFVISLADGDVDNHDRGVAAWLDMLGDQGFGNYRQLLERVSLNPLMGIYLSHIANQKADAATGRVPDENYAREVMQLFTIGLVELSEDGSTRKNSVGAAIESYTSADVSGLAKVFTGWSWDCPDWPQRNCFLRGENNGRSDPDRALKPMVAYPMYHSTEAKSFLGTTIPAQNTGNPADSLRMALDRLAAHPNVGPFIGRQLIQRFTTSNPSPVYVSAVARAFSSSGGDMKAVLKAVLMHPEARRISDTSGKVREPVLRLSALLRAFPHRSASGKYEIEITDSPGFALAQTPLHAPSVFNFYRPGYVAPGTQSAARNMVAPELQIAHETSVSGYVNYMRDSIGAGAGNSAGVSLGKRDLKANYSAELALAADAPALVDHVTTRLTYGAIGAARRSEIINAVSAIAIPGAGSSTSRIDEAKRNRVNAALLLTVAAPEFVVLK